MEICNWSTNDVELMKCEVAGVVSVGLGVQVGLNVLPSLGCTSSIVGRWICCDRCAGIDHDFSNHQRHS